MPCASGGEILSQNGKQTRRLRHGGSQKRDTNYKIDKQEAAALLCLVYPLKVQSQVRQSHSIMPSCVSPLKLLLIYARF